MDVWKSCVMDSVEMAKVMVINYPECFQYIISMTQGKEK